MDVPTNTAQIERLIRRWESAICAGDLDGVTAAHTADIVMFDVPAPIKISGMADYEATWHLFFAHNEAGPDRFRITDLQITAGDTAAFAHGLLTIGGGTETHCRLTMGFRKDGAEWRITHEHHSMPLP